MSEDDRSVGIRRARRGDWRTLTSTFREVFPEDLPGRELGRRLAVGYRNIFLAESGGVLRGFYVMTVNQDPACAWLDYVGVVASSRRAGLGGALLDHFEREARRRGFHRVGLAVRKTNEGALALYASHGYAVTGESGPGWVLAKDLGPEAVADGRPGKLEWGSRPSRVLDKLLFALWIGRGD